MPPTSSILSVDELSRLTRGLGTNGVQAMHYETSEDFRNLWSRLLDTVHHPTVSDKHMTAACNAICFVVRTNACNPNEDTRSIAYSSDTWKQAFGAARGAFASGKNKPALQVLDTLAYLTETNVREELICPDVTEAALQMVKIVLTQQPRKALKEACIVLCFFLKKLSAFMSFSDVLETAYQDCRPAFVRQCRAFAVLWEGTHNGFSDQWSAFILSLLMVTRVVESKSATLKLLALLCSTSLPGLQIDMFSIFNNAIELYCAANETALQDVSRDVLPSILTNAEQYHAFLSKQTHMPGTKLSSMQVVLALLQLGKSKGFVTETELPYKVASIFCNPDCNPEDFLHDETEYLTFEYLMSNASADIRLGACELLTASTSTKSPPPTGALRCLARSLRYLHDDMDAFQRGKFFSTFRRFLIRCQSSQLMLGQSRRAEMSLDRDSFMEEYVGFLKSELASHLSYGRHILALELLYFMSDRANLKDGALPKSIMVDPNLLTSLFGLVLDPFDDVRSIATEILQCTIFTDELAFTEAVERLRPVTEASRLAAATNRAGHADALGRLISLTMTSGSSRLNDIAATQSPDRLSQLVHGICAYGETIQNFDLFASYPLHGTILGIAYTLERKRFWTEAPQLPAMQRDLLTFCDRIWTLSQPQLCVDSPEMETEVVDEADMSGPKDLLAYAWRALRDSNVLMQAMLNCFSTDFTLLKTIGDLCFNQLALLRHRGAFSTVSQTFVLCCQKVRGSKDPDVAALNGHWFKDALNELENQADKLTRRSAGLPAMFTALLDPHVHHQFSASFQVLVDIAMQETPESDEAKAQERVRLPQVHALNCIKDIMTTSRFRVMTEVLVVPTINLAAVCMSSPIWAIKNCGLMLLRASINRLDPDTGVGAGEAGLKHRGTSAVTQSPLDIALALLGADKSQMSTNATTDRLHTGTASEFAGLDLLGRLYLDNTERRLVRKLVAGKLRHEIWYIRTQAARLLAGLVQPGEELMALKEILSLLDTDSSANGSHGRLLLIARVLDKMEETMDVQEYLTTIVEIITSSIAPSPATFSKTSLAVQVDVATQLANLPIKNLGQKSFVLSDLDDKSQLSQSYTQEPHALCDRALAWYWLSNSTHSDVDIAHQALRAMREDSDVALYVLDKLQERFVQSTKLGLEVAVSILCSAEADDVRTSAMNTVVAYCQHQNETLSALVATKLVAEIDFRKNVSRSLMVSQLRLYALLCSQGWECKHHDILPKLKASAQGFCLHLRAAANDDIDDATRQGAVESLWEWKAVRGIKVMLEDLLGQVGRLEIISVLYDLLNDDDEDIRQTAAEAAVIHYNPNADTDHALDILCCSAAREKLREQLQRDFAQTETFSLECTRRLLNMKMTVAPSRILGAVTTHCRHGSVQQQVKRILIAANELFAEEKQNLYIDELAEIKAWAEIFSRIPLDRRELMPQAKFMVAWTNDGMQVFKSILDRKSDQSHGADEQAEEQIPGLTKPRDIGELRLSDNEDLDMLLTRVIVIARIMGGYEHDLAQLEAACVHNNQFASAVSAFTWSLG